jgi:uncharacterized protein (TIGR03435 family)
MASRREGGVVRRAARMMRYDVVVLMLACSIAQLHAQTRPVRPAEDTHFDVVSIKPCDPGKAATSEEFMRLLGGEPVSGKRFYQPCRRVAELAMFAYDLPRARVRYPSATSFEYFEIDGRASSPVSLSDMRLMVRQLLADRFALRSHTEVVTADVYTLVLARPDGQLGPSARPATIDCSPAVLDAPPDEKRRVHCESSANVRNGVMTRVDNGITMSRFAESLSPKDVVVDGTGLKGIFDLTFSYDVRLDDIGAPPIDNTARDRALETQLGLKLVRSKGPVEILVIDSVGRPTPN